MTKLSVNINKIATLRNARGGNNPNLIQVARDCEKFGAQGITVHPRPDQRHIKYSDAYNLKEVITTEFNIEGNPTKDFMEMVLQLKPHQVTLVPDAPNAITSNAGWDTIKHQSFLQEVILELKSKGIRTSVFIEPDEKQIYGALAIKTDRIELYTESYAKGFLADKDKAIEKFKLASKIANSIGIGLNAGHDLDLANLKFFKENIIDLLEVSIGHALICDSLYFGLHNTIQMYKKQLNG
jgi:pyridoxine 5-phosphate synthase